MVPVANDSEICSHGCEGGLAIVINWWQHMEETKCVRTTQNRKDVCSTMRLIAGSYNFETTITALLISVFWNNPDFFPECGQTKALLMFTCTSKSISGIPSSTLARIRSFCVEAVCIVITTMCPQGTLINF